MTALLYLVEDKVDAFMNITLNDYIMKKQKKGQWKWIEKNGNTTQEMLGFLVAEISKDSHVGLLGDRFFNHSQG